MDNVVRARLMDAAVRARTRLSLTDAASLLREALGEEALTLSTRELVSREVMDEFRKLNEADVVWSAGGQAWRLRRPTDPPGRAAPLEEAPEVLFDDDHLPLLLTAKVAATYLGFARTAFYRYDITGVTPQCMHLGGRRFWRRDELREWVDAGCPPRHKWDVLLKAKEHGVRSARR
jgi:predicted DNA-binding transcriptional regulator AlpA